MSEGNDARKDFNEPDSSALNAQRTSMLAPDKDSLLYAFQRKK